MCHINIDRLTVSFAADLFGYDELFTLKLNQRKTNYEDDF